MKDGVNQLLQQAQQMQKQIDAAQEELARLEVTGEAGAGLVRVTMTCRHDVRRVRIDPGLLTQNDLEMLEDLVAAALNDAVRRAEKCIQERMSKLLGGARIPGMKLPF